MKFGGGTDITAAVTGTGPPYIYNKGWLAGSTYIQLFAETVMHVNKQSGCMPPAAAHRNQ